MDTGMDITIHQYNGSDYDTLYPKTKSTQMYVSDKVQTDLELPVDANVDDAFQVLANKLALIKQNMAIITLTVVSTSGNPLSGVRVNGIYDEQGNVMTTDTEGVISGYVNEGDVTLSVSGYADIVDFSETFTVVRGGEYAKTITLATQNFLKIINSTSVKFSGNVETIDVSVVGGGAGGGGATSIYNNVLGGPGGSGGYVVTTDGIVVSPDTEYPIVIGAGGEGGEASYGTTTTTGTGGGASSAFGITANGASACTAGTIGGTSSTVGLAGAGNGIGGAGTNGRSQARVAGNVGGDGKVEAYISFTETTTLGAGGGSGSTFAGGQALGGVEGGGAGGNNKFQTSSNGQDGSDATANTGSGGGGGAATAYADPSWNNYAGKGGNGADGVVTIRIHLLAA